MVPKLNRGIKFKQQRLSGHRFSLSFGHRATLLQGAGHALITRVAWIGSRKALGRGWRFLAAKPGDTIATLGPRRKAKAWLE
jgi:hypothetical protein